MSNLAIILCVALCVSAGNAFSWADSLKKAQENVQKFTAEAINKIDEQFVSMQLKTHTVAAELSNKTNAFTSKIQYETKSVVENTNKANEESIHSAEEINVNVDECKDAADSKTLDDLVVALIESTKKCVDEKVETGLGYLEEISNTADKVLTEVEEARSKNEHCGDNVEDSKSALAGILCSKEAAASASWTALKTAPQMTLAWTKVNFLTVSASPALSLCTRKERLAFFAEAATLRTKVELCIHKKIAEAKETTPESH